MNKTISVLLVSLLAPALTSAATPFTSGHVVVLRCAGNSSGGNAGALVEYAPDGTLVQTVAFPSTGSPAIVFGNSTTLVHGISLSADGALVVIPGYAALAAANIEATTAAVDNRVLATVKWDGTVAYPIINSAFASGASVRGATSDGFGNFWGVFTSGLRYLSSSAPGAATTVISTGIRACAIFNGQLYFSVTAGVNGVSPNLATTSASSVSYITGATSSDGFAIPPGPTTGSKAYIANYSDTTGISAFNWNGSSWDAPYIIKFSGITGNPEHLAVDYSGASPALYFTTTSGTNNSLYKYVDSAGTGGTFAATAVASATGGAILRGVALAPTQPALPSFTTQPSGDTKNYGDTITFGPVAATGANPNAWTWKQGTTTLTDGGRISGSTTPTLTISGIMAADAGSYYAIAANNGGTTSSDPAVLALAGSCISPQLVSITNVAGSTAHFTAGISACQAPIASYSWVRDGNPVSDGPTSTGSTVSGASTGSLTITGVQGGDAGLYTLTLIDGNSQPSISAATLTVLDLPGITQQPGNQNKAAGGTATFTITATGGSLFYNWFKSPSTTPLANGPSGSGGTISGATTARLTIAGVQDGDAGTYSVTVTNLAGSQPSDPAELTVGHAPSVTALASVNVMQGADAVFPATVTGTPTMTYTWKHNGAVLFNDGSHIFGADTATLSITNVQVADALSYSVTAVNSYGTTSSNVFLGVEIAAPKPNTVPGQFIYDPFDYPAGPYPASSYYSWDHIITIYNQQTGEPAFWTALGGLNAAVQGNDLLNYVGVNRVPPGEYPWPGVDCNSVNLWYWSSAANNNHLRFGGINQTNGAAYFSCLLHIDQGATLSQGTFDVIGGFTSDTTADTWNYKLCTQVSSGGDAYWLGVFKGVGAGVSAGSINGQWALAKPLGRGQLHFVVGCYKFGSGTNLVGGSLTNDDIVALWIDPDRSTFGALEANVPVPNAGGLQTNWATNAAIADFGLKGTVPPASKRLTELRIGRTWASVTPPYYPAVKISNTPADVTLSWPAKDTPYDPANGVYRGYTFQKAEGLTGWSDIAPPYTPDGTGTNNTYTESIGSSQYYRLVYPPR